MKDPRKNLTIRLRLAVLSIVSLVALCAAESQNRAAGAQNKRPMAFMDIMEMRQATAPAVAPDGKWALYTLSAPDWKAARSFTDIYLVSLDAGLPSIRQMTFTKDKNESSPRWSRDARYFVFASNREAPQSNANQNQLYLMRPDGGEARKITEAKDGVGSFAFSRDGGWLAFSAGKDDDQQVWILPAAEIETAKPQQLTKHATPVASWQFSPDGKRIYFISPDSSSKESKERVEQKFTVRIRNEEAPLNHLWAVDLDSKKESRLTSGADYSVSDVTTSKDSKWLGFRGTPKDRYQRTVTEATIYADLYLFEVATGKIERLTDNKEIGESALSFSPDSSTIAFSAPDDFTYFRNNRVYIRPVQSGQGGGQWKKLGGDFDGDVSTGFWSEDGKTIYFNEGWRATNQLFSVSTETGKVTQLTKEKAIVFAAQDEDTKRLIINYSDPATPTNWFTAQLSQINNRATWKQITDSNPQVKNLALGETEEIEWKSSDGKMVGGVLVKPVNYERGKRYPLIVQIHGGPASASTLTFIGNHGNYSHVYAGAGYVCLLPNYRGSTNYGEKFKMEIGGDYFRQAYDDIMAGVDHLINIGLVEGDKMGVMGWSAGGHWSNWILTHTDRFKAISSGAGAVNWISMYAQSDIQRNREFYYGGRPPYEDFDKYWNVSPLKYIKNARTPTLIHVVDGDPRVPRPQSEELHMALKKLGVPTEFFVYPGATHGITEPRNQMVKMVSEFNWFEKWIRGKQSWFEWKEMLQTLKDEKADEKKAEFNGPDGVEGTDDDFDAILFPQNRGAAAPAKAGYPSIVVPGGFVPPTGAVVNPAPFGVAFTGRAFSPSLHAITTRSKWQAPIRNASPIWPILGGTVYFRLKYQFPGLSGYNEAPERSPNMSILTAESVLKMIEQLPPTERTRLNQILAWKQAEFAKAKPPLDKRAPCETMKDRTRELKWIEEHKHEYVGQWVALDGDRLIMASPIRAEISAAIKADGAKLPLVHRITSPDEPLPIGI